MPDPLKRRIGPWRSAALSRPPGIPCRAPRRGSGAGPDPQAGRGDPDRRAEAPGLDPHLTISFLTHSYVSLAYSQLVRFPNGPEQKSPTDFSILPDLAEKWVISKDGKVYTFTLRKGVRFHNKPPVNGREVTAEDVKYSLERFMAKSGFRERFEPVQAIDVVDRHTVRITLKEVTRRSSITSRARASAPSWPARRRTSSRTSTIPTR